MITADQLRELERAVGAAALVLDDRRQAYAADELKMPHLPEAVVDATTVEQIQALMRWANRHHVPVTPRGAGTGLSGGALANRGGVVLSMARFNRILEIDPVNRFAVVEPGVINMTLQAAAAAHGLFYPPDPASWESCSLGGNVAEESGGPHCVKYGATRPYVLQIEAVLPSGETVVCGVRTRKGVVGYSLRDLLIGSEGTLAIFTKLVLRLLPKPRRVRTLLALLPDLASAGRLVTTVFRAGLCPSCMEFMDERALDLVRDQLPLALPAACRAVVLLEADGGEEEVEREAELLGGSCLDAGALDVLVADGGEKRERLWEVRRRLSTTTRERFVQKLSEDIAVPLDRLEECLAASRRLGDEAGLTVLAYGHIGDGNLHVNVLSTVPGPAENRRMWLVVGEVFRLAVQLDGTISAEHGVGCWKQSYIGLELSPLSQRLQMDIKRLFDPNNILNPGKIFDWPQREETGL
ncbi:MAG: FAD-linked oxidase C-terminal domain-containing protein [bacterium]|nr:FAD-linked oxidase C-terminal domain-containing protein [bacterium]